MEERRLAYVAVTRAHYQLIASGYRWGSASKPLAPSDFLLEIRDTADRVAFWAPEVTEGATNPLLAEPAEAVWPVTPEGLRYESVLDGARLVEAALDRVMTAAPAEGVQEDAAGAAGVSEDAVRGAGGVPGDAGVSVEGGRGAEVLRAFEEERVRAWERDTDLLLRERELHRRRGSTTVELPTNLTVSSLVTLAGDARELARRIRRPVPVKPAPLARRGTSFHRWLETRWDQQRLIDDFELDLLQEPEEADVRLADLQERFEQSEWAERKPLDLEVPFETMIADRLVRGRMDAVFELPDGRYEVVDWKTGEPPKGKAARVGVGAARGLPPGLVAARGRAPGERGRGLPLRAREPDRAAGGPARRRRPGGTHRGRPHPPPARRPPSPARFLSLRGDHASGLAIGTYPADRSAALAQRTLRLALAGSGEPASRSDSGSGQPSSPACWRRISRAAFHSSGRISGRPRRPRRGPPPWRRSPPGG